MKRRRDNNRGGGDDDDDDDDDDDRRKRKLLEELFLNAPTELQKKLALSVFDHFHSNIKTSSSSSTTTSLSNNKINILSHKLIEMNNIEGLNYILLHGTNINEIDEEGNTLLHKSCMYNNWSITSLLISTLFMDNMLLLCGNLDLFIRNKKNQLAVEMTSNKDIKKLLYYCMNQDQILSVFNNNNNKKMKLNEIVDGIKNDENDIYVDNTVFKYQGNVIQKQQNSDILFNYDKMMNIEIFIKPFSMDLNEYIQYKKSQNNKNEEIIKKKKVNPFKISKPKCVDIVKSSGKVPFIVNKVLAPAASAPPSSSS